MTAGSSRKPRNCLCIRYSAAGWSFAGPRRHPRDPVAFEAAELREGRRPDNLLERALMGGDVLADGMQLRRIGRAHAAANPDPGGGHLEVEAGAVHPAERRFGHTAAMFVLSGALSLPNRVSRHGRNSDSLDRPPDPARYRPEVVGQVIDDGDHGAADVLLASARWAWNQTRSLFFLRARRKAIVLLLNMGTGTVTAEPQQNLRR